MSKTSMQELLEWAKDKDISDTMISPQDLLNVINPLLEKEKEQIIEFGYKCRNKCKKESKLLPQDIFNTTYNQKQ